MDLPDVIQEKGLAEGIKAAFKILENVIGPPSKATGELVAFPLVAARAELFLRFARRYKRLVEEWGINERQVPLKIWFPIAQGASLEEDKGMQERWAALLARAAEGKRVVLPAFVQTLSQLSPAEAKLLDQMYQDPASALTWSPEYVARESDVSVDEAELLLEHLGHLGLCERSTHTTASATGRVLTFGADGPTIRTGSNYDRTVYGTRFVAVCRTPKLSGA